MYVFFETAAFTNEYFFNTQYEPRMVIFKDFHIQQ